MAATFAVFAEGNHSRGAAPMQGGEARVATCPLTSPDNN
jgi:hypothetical protein